MAFLDLCSSFKFLAVDTEGYAPNILGISVAHPALSALYFPVGHRENVNIDKEVFDKLQDVLQTVSFRIFHNAGHDLIALPYLFDLPFFDTMIGGHMVDENVISKSLDWMVKTYCPGEDAKQRPELMQQIIDMWGWYQVPYALVAPYATQDALITMKLFLKLLPLFEAQFGELWTPSSK
jgi:hypothetical protein